MRRLPKVVDGVSLNLPFVSVSVKPQDLERRVAREVIIRMADRRVLNAFECCDDCIEYALGSLQEIRRILVDKQVDLADEADGPLYLLLEAMAEGIRQFSTFEQMPSQHPERRQMYFGALEMLRAHLHRVLGQVALIASIEIPKIADRMRYDNVWELEAYVRPALPPATQEEA
jgi:hypothetical protein